MQKKENRAPLGEHRKTFFKIIFSSLGGVAVLGSICFLFALMMLSGVLTPSRLGLWAGIAVFLGGTSAGALMGSRGQILLCVLLAFCLMIGILFLVGQLLFGGRFQPVAEPLLLTALLFGLALGNAMVNLR